MAMNTIKIAILEPCILLRMGLETVLKKSNRFKPIIKIIQEDPNADYNSILCNMYDTIFIVDPICLGAKPRSRYNVPNSVKLIAFSHGGYGDSTYSGYDDVISQCMSLQNIIDTILNLQNKDERHIINTESNTLTSREREIVVCVVKGMTNKQIADNLYLSTHTVITHRRNISKKLQIHSTSGLTVYAIMNKLVDLNDIENK